MTIIDGIGDEVTYFFISVVVIIIATIAWITTDIQQNLYVRTVYLLEHSRHHTRVTTLTNHTESATISEGVEFDSAESAETEVVVEAEDEMDDEDDHSEDPVIEEIIETMDATDETDASDANVLRQRRLQRFQNTATETDSPSETSITTEEILPDRIIPEVTNIEEPTNETTTNGTGTPITIKLKFIDDNMRIVDARLHDLLGDFKRRHFDVELASNKLVRLIFNGQVLKHDQQTLQSYGMFDNCVVHCLVHQPRSPLIGENPTPSETNSISIGNNSTQAHRDWDLGNLLIATLSFTLISAWYFRFQYPQLFTIWTTIGLIGLTSGFGVIALVRYFPDVLTRDQVIVVQ